MTYTPRNAVVTFRCTAEMAQDLARLGGDTENTRSNVCYLLLASLLAGSGPDMLKLLERRR